MSNQRAVIHVGTDYQNGKNLSDKKRMIRAWSLVVVHVNPAGRELRELATVRWYKSPSTIYCSIWFQSSYQFPNYQFPNYHNSGHGQAGGHGYDKFSAAFANACASAGIWFAEEIAGRGDGAVRGALEAIANAHGYRSADTLVVEHD